MAIRYEIHTIENAQGTGKERLYIQLKNAKAMTADELESAIENACSVTKGDVKAVLSELARYIVQELSQGSRFYLPEIGYLSLSVGNTPPSQKPDGKITGNDIFVRNINFQPEGKLLDEIKKRTKFIKSPYTSRSTKYTEEELWAKVSDYIQANHYITCGIMTTKFKLSKYMALKWLSHFTESGRLSKGGTDHAPIFLFNTSVK